jgi:hypothetical protein
MAFLAIGGRVGTVIQTTHEPAGAAAWDQPTRLLRIAETSWNFRIILWHFKRCYFAGRS